MFVKAGQTYFNTDQISKVITQGNGTAIMYFSGGDNRFVLNLAATEALAMTALNTLLTPYIDVTPYLVESSLEQ